MRIDPSIINYLKSYFVGRKGASTVGGNLTPDADTAYSLGSSSRRFDTIYTRLIVADNFSTVSATSDTVDGFHAYSTPNPNALLALDGSSIFPTSVYPSALLVDGSRALTGNLSVDPGITIDGVDISAHAADSTKHHNSGMSADDHTNYVHITSARTINAVHTFNPAAPNQPFVLGANAQGQTVTGLNADLLDGIHGAVFVQVTRSVFAGSGLTGGGNLNADITLNVGAGTGISVAADAVAVDQAFSPTWTGLHTFNRAGAPFAIGASSAGQLVTSLNADTTDGVHFSGSGFTLTVPATGTAVLGTGTNTQVAYWTGTNTLAAGSFITYNSGSGDLTIAPTGNVTISPTGDVIFNPTGNDLLPTNNYDLNLGSISKKYLTLYAAELWVETLVAANTMATIGGRILVAPTTELTSDLAPAGTSILVKHNNLAVNDVIYLEANGNVEYMQVTAGPTGTGPYTYTVTRNLDGSGANQWYAGDAVLNTGTTNDGFIDIYSVRGIKEGTDVGPTIVGNVRNSGTYNDYSEAWAIGNLNGLYGYASDVYGVGLGKYNPSAAYITIDPTNGIRMFSSATKRVELTNAGVLTLNDSTGAPVFTFNTSAGAEFTKPLTLASTGGIYQGTGTFASPTTGLKMWNDSSIGRIGGYNSGTLQWYGDSDGKFYTGAGSVLLDVNGVQFLSQSVALKFKNAGVDYGGLGYVIYPNASPKTYDLWLEQGFAGSELVVNGTFDSDITGWTNTSTTGGGQAVGWNSAGHAASGSIAMVVVYDPSGSYVEYTSTNFITGITAGDAIIITGWVQFTLDNNDGSNAGVVFVVDFYNSSDVFISTAGSGGVPFTSSGAWVQARSAAVAPTNTAKMKIRFYASKAPTPIGDVSVRVDDISVKKYDYYQALTLHTASSGVPYANFSGRLQVENDVLVHGGIYSGSLWGDPLAGTITAEFYLEAKGTGASNGVFIGGDTQLYRSAADVLRTPDAFQSDTKITAAGDGSSNGVYIGTDTQLYRNAADVLRTPDSFVVDGNVGVGTTSPAHQLNIASVSAGSTRGVSIDQYTLDTVAPLLFLSKSRGTSVGGHTAVQSGDNIGVVAFRGSDGAQFRVSSKISVVSDGTFSGTSAPSKLEFYTTPSGSLTNTLRLTIDSAGNVINEGIYTIKEQAAPSTPASGYGSVYVDTSGYLRFKNDGGMDLSASGAYMDLPVGTGELHSATLLGWGTWSIDAWTFNQVGNQYIQWAFRLPSGWAGRTLNYAWLWGISTAGSGNIRWYLEASRVYDTGTLPAAATVSQVQDIAVPGTTNEAKLSTGSVSLASWSDGDWISIRLGRDGDHANDTFGQSGRCIGLRIWVS